MVDDRQRQLYARQILLPEVGMAGQARLLGSTAVLADQGDPQARAVTRLYMQRAGLPIEDHMADDIDDEMADDPARRQLSQDTPLVRIESPTTATVTRSAGGDPSLQQAAAALHGALAAVEGIKSALGAGTPSRFDDVVLASAHDAQEER